MKPRVPITPSSSLIVWAEGTSTDLWIGPTEHQGSRPGDDRNDPGGVCRLPELVVTFTCVAAVTLSASAADVWCQFPVRRHRNCLRLASEDLPAHRPLPNRPYWSGSLNAESK